MSDIFNFNKKKKEGKSITLTQQMQKSNWKSSPISNGGLWFGFMYLFVILSIFLGFSNHLTQNEKLFGVLMMSGFGLFFTISPHSIKLKKDSIEIQPLLLSFLHLPFGKKVIFNTDIMDVKIEAHKGPYWEDEVSLELKTRRGKIKINTEYYNIEIPYAIYKIIKSRAGA